MRSVQRDKSLKLVVVSRVRRFNSQLSRCPLVKFVFVSLVMYKRYSFSSVILLHHCNLLYLP